jgi:hypothetical protein
MAGYLENTGPITTAVFNQNTAATFAVVAANASATRKPRLLGLNLIAAGNVSVTVLAAAVAIYGPVALTANVPLNLPFSPAGWGDGAVNTAINITLSAGVQVGGAIIVQHIDQ